MSGDELLKALSSTLSKKQVLQLSKIAIIDGLLKDVLDLTVNCEPKIAFRASWLLEHVAAAAPQTFIPFVPCFIKLFREQVNFSCQRHFTKIIIDLISRDNRRILSKLSKEELDILVETTFSWLINTKTPVAVQVNCLSILYYLCQTADWIPDELTARISLLMKNGSAAVQARGKRIIHQLSSK